MQRLDDKSWTILIVALQQDLDELEKWAKKWQMKFNANKCKVMHIGNKDSTETPYSVGQALEVRNLV